MTDLQIDQLKKARQGDMDAFADLFESFRPLLCQVAFRLVGADDCEDVVMDSFLKVWRALPDFRGDAKLKTWLCAVVRNCSLDYLRKRKRIIHFTPIDESAGNPVENISAAADDAPDRRAELQDLGDQMTLALNRLSDQHRTALLMHEVDDMAYKDIAAATGVSIGTVMSRLFHARRHLRELLKPVMDG
ncbi:MAG: sigma-70 family RNA polymerase sigma factor [Lentisphaeria bacterium]|nr:sigma-70 family RNA polymerase sigma factor [Lentisphaeria bacterium]